VVRIACWRSELAIEPLLAELRACQVCAAALPFGARPIVQAGSGARLLIISQAPGSRAHASGIPWTDASGDRLRAWTGVERPRFFDPDCVAIMPMAFCYPGVAPSGGDAPPRRECAPLWHARLLAALPAVRLVLLVGGHAQKAYLPRVTTMTEAVRHHDPASDAPWPLPHPSWRSIGWMRRNPWFETDIVPALQARVAVVLA